MLQSTGIIFDILVSYRLTINWWYFNIFIWWNGYDKSLFSFQYFISQSNDIDSSSECSLRKWYNYSD